jgi:hypothetical protein
VCCFVFKMKAKGGRAWREVMLDRYRKKQRGAIRDLANLWRLTRNRKLKQEMGARQVHLDSGTYRNGAGPTHFHQCGALLFLASDGTRISSTYRLFTFSGSKSSMPLTLLLIACPHPSANVTASAPAGFVSSKGQTSLQGIRSLSLRSC